MGAWGVGLYQSDDALDLKSTFLEDAKLPIDTDALVARICTKYGLGKDPHDEDETQGWLALADQLHRFGIDHAPTFATAREIITSGADLKAMEALEMSPRDLTKRAKMLDTLLESWATPHPKPRTRKMMKGAEPLILEQGQVWVMPAMDQSPLPFFWYGYDPKTIDQIYKPNGWAGFVVFEAYHYDTFFARYLLAMIDLPGPDRPTLAQIPEICIRTMNDPAPYLDDDDELQTRMVLSDMVFTLRIDKPRKTLKTWQAECLGTLPAQPDAAALREAVVSEAKEQHLAPDGVASLEHLMTLGSFHHSHGNMLAGEPSIYAADPDKPISRFLKP